MTKSCHYYYKGFFLSLFVFFLSGSLAYASQWATTYGGENNDQAKSVYQTSDGGFIAAGCTNSYGAGNGDLWVLKFNADGSLAWQKIYGGINRDCAYSIQQTDDDADGQKDDGYIVTGASDSYGIGSDFWVLKLNSDGSVAWQKTFIHDGRDEPWSIQQTAEGGYIVTGPTRSAETGDDVWVLKLGSDGSVIWQKKYGGTNTDWAYSIQQTDDDADGQKDDGYIVAGYTASFGAGGNDAWLLKLNADGAVVWEKTYGTNNNEEARLVQQTIDSSYIVTGSTAAFGDANSDIWVFKLNTDGTVAWEKRYGGIAWDGASFIQQTGDGGYIVSGGTSSYGSGLIDAWVLKLNENGSVAWEKTYGGTGDDWVSSVQQTTDGGYILAGTTWSFGAGGSDAWVMKLNGSGEIYDCSTMGTSGATVNNTNATINNTNATKTSTSIAGTDTNATVSIPSPTETEVCLANAEITLPQTGQTTCYDSGGAVISCAGTGQDGDIQAGVPWPDPRFIDNSDGTVTDGLTGLMWTQDGNAPGPPACSPGITKTWQGALDYVACLNANSYLGYTDWHMPNVSELENLVNAGQSNSASWLNTQGFNNVQPPTGDGWFYYWSSTSSIGTSPPGDAWIVSMLGDVSLESKLSSDGYVWPVRSGLSGAAPLWETGQTTCYDSLGNMIACSGTGQDGEIQAGFAWPNPRFTVSGDCVTDNLTGLMWTKDANLPGMVMTWQQSLDYADSLSICGYIDWRIPNRKELHSLTDFSRFNPALPIGHPFLNVQSGRYWSSTSDAVVTDYAWAVDRWFGYTNEDSKSLNPHYVWTVRSGEVSLPVYSITGTVTAFENGTGLGGVSLTLSGDASAMVTTAADGTYSFAGLADGSYTITPSKTNYTFNPSNIAVTVSGADAPSQDFTGNLSGSISIPLASGLSNSPVSIAIDATSVYWTEGSTSGAVKKVPINGGTVTTLAPLGGYPAVGIAVDSNSVYWAEQSGTLKKVSINGGTVTTLALGMSTIWGMTGDSNYVYWTETNTVKKVSINGGTVTTVANGIGAAHSITVDANSVYWTGNGGGMGLGTVKKVGINGGTVTTLVASGLSQPEGIAVDSTNVYWTEFGGTVKKVSINGGIVTTLASGPSTSSGIAVDSANVYWKDDAPMAVNKVSINGGTVTTLATSRWWGQPAGIAIDSSFVYWTEPDAVKKVAKGDNFAVGDLAGNWNFHLLTSGDSPQWLGWAHADVSLDGAGNYAFSNYLNSSGDTSQSSTTGTMNIDSNGVVTLPGQPSYHAVMSLDKNTVVGTMNDGGGGYEFFIGQRTGNGFTQSDLAGNWYAHVLSSGDSPQYVGWAHWDTGIDGAGNCVMSNYLNSSGDTSQNSTTCTMSIDSSGMVTFVGSPSFHAMMSIDKNTIVGTMNDGGGGYDLFVLQRRGSNFVQSELAGDWRLHALLSGDAPQRSGWVYGDFSIDPSGGFTGSATFSYGVTKSLNPGTWPIDTNGVVTDIDDTYFHGTVGINKDMMLFTDWNGVDGYMLGVMTKNSPTVTSNSSIQGTVKDNGVGIGGVSMILSGDASASTTTADDGTYRFTGLDAGTYTVTPTLSGSAFSPASITIEVMTGGAQATNMDFELVGPPVVSGIYPGSGPVGTLVFIQGSDFGATVDNTHVAFNGVEAAIVSSGIGAPGHSEMDGIGGIPYDGIQISGLEVLVPSGATTGPVVVTVNGVSSNSGHIFTVTAFNNPPVLGPIGAKVDDEGGHLSFVVSGSDPDGGPLTFSASNLPTGASFDPDTQTFSWTPNYAQAGIYNVTVTVSDGTKSDSEDVLITVYQVGAFVISDLAGDWAFHMLISGDNPQWIGWSHGDMNIDGNGNFNATSETTSVGETTNLPQGTFSIAPDGTVSMSEETSFHGVMSTNNNMIVGTMNDGGGGYDLLILQRRGGTFAQSDLQGDWQSHLLASGDSPQWSGWAHWSMSIDGSGNFAFSDYLNSSGDTSQSSATGILYINSNGILSMEGQPSFQAVMSLDKNMVIGTMDDGGGGYDLVIMQRSGSNIVQSDIAGDWRLHGILAGDAPQRLGWVYGDFSIDPSGGYTAAATFSYGVTETLNPSTVPIDANGVISDQNEPYFHGILGLNKDIIVFTHWNGVDGYMLGVMTKFTSGVDTDGDGFPDQQEINAGSDPNNPNSRPGTTTLHLHTGFNLVSFPAETLKYGNMYNLMDALGGNNLISTILVYDSNSQTFREFGYDLTGQPYGQDFNFNSGQDLLGLIIYATQDATIPLTSLYCPTWDLSSGMNLYGAPCIASDMTAFQLLKKIGDETVVNSIQRFNPDTGRFETAVYKDGQPAGVDFRIIPGEGIFIYMKKALQGFRPDAGYSMADLSGTWYVAGINTPQKGFWYPDFGYDFDTMTLQNDGTGTYTCMSSSDGCGPTENVSGVSVSQDGVITPPPAPNSDDDLVMGKGKDIMINIFRDNQTGQEHQAFGIFVRKAASYTTSDLAGTWYSMGIGTPKKGFSDPDKFGYDFERYDFLSDGTGTITCIASIDSCGPPQDISGLSISQDGIMTSPLGPNEALSEAMGINKDILIGIWRDNNTGAEEYGYSISVRMAASYSMQDLAGTWYVMDIKTPQKGFSYPNHFGFDFDTITLNSDGTGTYTCNTSSDPCGPPEAISGFSISPDGIITTPLWPNEVENFVMGENKNIMIQIFRDNTPGDEHQVFSVFVKKAE